jgi:hypothetical protein
MRKTGNYLKIWFRNRYRRDSSREAGIYGRIILKLSLEALYVKNNADIGGKGVKGVRRIH